MIDQVVFGLLESRYLANWFSVHWAPSVKLHKYFSSAYDVLTLALVILWGQDRQGPALEFSILVEESNDKQKMITVMKKIEQVVRIDSATVLTLEKASRRWGCWAQEIAFVGRGSSEPLARKRLMG